MVNKPAASSKATAGSASGKGSRFRGTVVGNYFFIVAVFPVNASAEADEMSPTQTWHFMRHASTGAEVSGFKLQLSGTAQATSNAFRIEVIDLDASFESEEEVRAYVDVHGRHWVDGAIDYRVCRAAIEPRELTEI